MLCVFAVGGPNVDGVVIEAEHGHTIVHGR
jgi:hypothetical protein